MLKKLSLIDLHKAVQDRVKKNTGLECYDSVPDNTPAPFYFVQVVGKRQADTKTMWCEIYNVWIHAIAEKQDGRVGIYDLIQRLEEALTEHITVPDHVELLQQTELGLQTLKIDATGEHHAVLAYDFKIAYGFKMKGAM